MDRLVVIDASPLIGLAIVDGIRWLPEIFGTVYLPESVKSEVIPGKAAKGKETIAQAIDAGLLKVWLEPIQPMFDIDLDVGETDCINLGLGHKGEVLLIMDERAGRAVAKQKGLKVAGTAAIIGIAKNHGLIDSAHKAFEILHKSDFRISAVVINQVLQSSGEQT